MSGAGTKLCRICGNGDLKYECAQPFDPSKVERYWGVDVMKADGKWASRNDNPVDNETPEFGDCVRAVDFDALALRYTNLQHFMRRMAEQYGFEMEETN
jgi:hypothetical protein